MTAPLQRTGEETHHIYMSFSNSCATRRREPDAQACKQSYAGGTGPRNQNRTFRNVGVAGGTRTRRTCNSERSHVSVVVHSLPYFEAVPVDISNRFLRLRHHRGCLWRLPGEQRIRLRVVDALVSAGWCVLGPRAWPLSSGMDLLLPSCFCIPFCTVLLISSRV